MSDKPRIVPIIVTTTGDDRAVLDSIAKRLVELRLAACVQIGGKITSHYRWQDRIDCTEEWQCVIKTCEGLYSDVERLILEHHNYQQPQIVAFGITAAHEGYLHWMREQLQQCS
jgi:periplasmic divalent cation tolerance protein